MAIRPKPRSEFGAVQKYVKFLKQFPRAKIIKPGHFYVYVYEIDETEPYNKIKFYDLMPFIFLFDVSHKNLFTGLNFHHIPVQSRKIWLSRVKSFAAQDFKNDRRIIRLTEYKKLFLMFRKASKVSVRNYRTDRVRLLRRVPAESVQLAMNYYANTYYGINISNVERKYINTRV